MLYRFYKDSKEILSVNDWNYVCDILTEFPEYELIAWEDFTDYKILWFGKDIEERYNIKL